MNIASIAALVGGIGTLLLGLAAIFRARAKPGDPVRLEVRAMRAEVRSLRRELALSDALLEEARRDLREARTESYRLKDQLSTLQTLVTALRKLVPGGEWLDRLGAAIDDTT